MKFIIANWKMNGDFKLIDEFIKSFDEFQKSDKKIIICPPSLLIAPFFNKLTELKKNSENSTEYSVSIGAQNCFYESKGAFTGENSPELIKQLGCEYVVLGHSERRNIFGESNEMIFKKWKAAVSFDLVPILCIGEKAEERSDWKKVLSAQLEPYRGILDLRGTIFAYEPVWSIGTKQIPSENEIKEVANFVREFLSQNTDNSNSYVVVYGGSVNSSNAQQIINIEGINGVLIGGASLKTEEFKAIIEK